MKDLLRNLDVKKKFELKASASSSVKFTRLG